MYWITEIMSHERMMGREKIASLCGFFNYDIEFYELYSKNYHLPEDELYEILKDYIDTHYKLADKLTPEENIECVAEKMNDILDTIKILYEDMDPETAREFFTVFPTLKKIPQLYRIALGNFSSSTNEEFNKTYESMDTSDPQKMALAIKILMEEESKNHRGYTVMNA